MTTIFKPLSLALVATLALLALTASTASAAEAAHFKADLLSGERATFHLEPDESETQLYTTNAGGLDLGGLDCNLSTGGKGEDADGTAASLTISQVSYSNTSCELTDIEFEAQIDLNSCKHYTFYSGAWLGPNEAEGTTDIHCEGTDVIEVTGPGCRLTWPAQINVGPIIYRNVSPPSGKDYVTIDFKITNFGYTGHKLLCNHTSPILWDGTYEASMNLTAFNEVGIPVDATIVERI